MAEEHGAGAPADGPAATGSAASGGPRPFFRVRLMNIDHVLVHPGPHDRAQSAFNPPGVPLRRVPVVRIFGATPAGQRVCLHVHGVFPYCYVQYHGSLHPDEVLAHVARLGRALNASLAASLRRDLSNPLTATSYIAAIHLVQGVPFYGYHVGARYFLKISFVDPSHNFRLATILQSGRVLGTVFQPFECHIRYQLQFMLDHNVYGCDYVDLERAFFRPPFPVTPDKLESADGIWHAGSIPSQFVQRPSPARASFCTLEVDAPAAAILNRRLLRPRNIHYSIPEPAPSTSENAQRLVPSLTELWEEERQRRTRAGLPPSIPVPDTAGEARRYGPGGAPPWMAEERLRAALRERCDEDERYRLERGYDARSYEGGNANDRFIVSAFESVELFHDAAAPQGASDPQTQAQTQHMSASQHAAASIYDLEHALTQHRARTHSGDTSQSAVSGSPASPRPPGSAHASQNFPRASPLSDADDRTLAADADFFASQAFQDAMRDFELEGQRADEADDGSDPGDDPTLDNAFDAAAPLTPRASRTVDAFKQSTPRQASRFAAPGTPQHTPTSAQSTPRRGPPSAQSTPKGKAPLTRAALSTPRKRHISDVFAAAANEEHERTPTRQQHTSNETPPRSVARSITHEASRTAADSPGSGAAKLRDLLDGSGADWRVLPDSQVASAAGLSQSAPRPDRSKTVATNEIENTTRASLPGATQRVRFGGATAGVPTALPSESDSGPSRSGLSRSTLPNTPRSDAGVRQWQYAQPAPSTAEVLNSFGFFGLPNVEHQDPFYSDPADVPKGAREYAGRSFRFVSKTLRFLPAFKPRNADADGGKKRQQRAPGVAAWTAAVPPPTRKSVQKWAHRNRGVPGEKRVQTKVPSTKPLPTAAKATQGDAEFKLSQRQPTVLVEKEKQHITVFALELLVCTRGDLMPDPAKDAISAIAFSFQNEDDSLEDTGSRPGLRTGLLLLDKHGTLPDPARLGIASLDVEVLSTELELFNALVDLVRTLDPEILVGWEIHNSSWGYVVDRAMKELNFDIIPELGRVNSGSTGGKGDKWGYTQTSGIKVTGRHMLNIWRLMRGELTLNQYSFDNVVFHLLRRRTPRFAHAVITQWYSSGVPALMKRALAYWVDRTEIDLEVIETSEVVFRTAEFARIYGVDFFSVISRGSQFKVESVMFRIAKPESFILPSPNQQQVGEQNAAEALPLVMEPQSAFYKGPLLVLDFTSLYPSLMIAYNLCYSTCLGRVSKFRDSWKLGFTDYVPPRGLLSLLEKDCFVSPNGMLFAKPHIRRSLLAKMLGEILETRVMVKGSVKGMKGEKAFKRLQNARQLSLKLLANVTYGYTSATFSGRMPCVEVADAIVQYGRETLERAISLIHATTEWGATVVYGDTDSLFIYLPGRTKEDAFRIGQAMADAVTADNPAPVKLKFEKVYLPSLLMAKKRYVGFMYETEDQTEPAFNAKGIETVRRDGFPAQQRMVEACIRILFRTQDLSLVKSYCQRQWRKIFEGRVPFSDFVIAKEVRLGSYSENGVPPPGAAIATRRLLLDRRNEPQHAERVPYIISQGMPRAKLNDQAVTPEQMLENSALRINARYYIERGLIPPLSRIFNLMGTDVNDWYRDMPRAVTSAWGGRFAADDMAETRTAAATRLTLADHYRSEHCLVCGRRTELDICPDCRQDLPATTGILASRLHGLEQRSEAMARICASCASLESVEDPPCVSIDCPVLYEKTPVARDSATARKILHHVVVAIEPDEAAPSEGRLWGAPEPP